MSISYINTSDVENIANNIITLSSDLETEFNNLFRRLSNVPSITKEWVGNQSEYYFNTIINDKSKYIYFSKKINNIGKTLNDEVEKINLAISTNNNDDFIRRD